MMKKGSSTTAQRRSRGDEVSRRRRSPVVVGPPQLRERQTITAIIQVLVMACGALSHDGNAIGGEEVAATRLERSGGPITSRRLDTFYMFF
jgi:hypothetical protein